MTENQRSLTPNQLMDEQNLEVGLRPASFEQFVGQKQTLENLKTYIQAANKRGEALDHVLLSGPPGLGKTTLARIMAKELGTDIKITSGPVMKVAGDLAGILTNLGHGDILFIDEIHRLFPVVEEFLYSAMEDFSIDIILDQGANARSINLKLKPFTLIGATTREGLLSAPFRARFLIQEKLSLYPPEELVRILQRNAEILGVKLLPEGAEIISQRSRGTPRVANRLLRRLRDVAQVHANGLIDKEMANTGLKMLGVDANGLDGMDRKILQTIVDHDGGPIGLKTLAVSVGEEEDSIESVYEPYLIQEGYLQRTPRGRVITRKAYRALGIRLPSDYDLFEGIEEEV